MADLYRWIGDGAGQKKQQGQRKTDGQLLSHLSHEFFLALRGLKGGTPMTFRELLGRCTALSFLIFIT